VILKAKKGRGYMNKITLLRYTPPHLPFEERKRFIEGGSQNND